MRSASQFHVVRRPDRRRCRTSRRLVAEVAAERLVVLVVAGDADQREVLRQQLGAAEIVERGQQALGEIAGRAEDDEDARVGAVSAADAVHAHSAALGSTWPPNLLRIADSSLSAKLVLLARAEAGVERRRQHVGRHRLLDRRHDGPAAFAGILDEAR